MTAPVVGLNPLFPYLQLLFETGMPYHFTRDLSKAERRVECKAQLKRGNHKSAKEDREKVHSLLEKEVTHGFSFTVPP